MAVNRLLGLHVSVFNFKPRTAALRKKGTRVNPPRRWSSSLAARLAYVSACCVSVACATGEAQVRSGHDASRAPTSKSTNAVLGVPVSASGKQQDDALDVAFSRPLKLPSMGEPLPEPSPSSRTQSIGSSTGLGTRNSVPSAEHEGEPEAPTNQASRAPQTPEDRKFVADLLGFCRIATEVKDDASIPSTEKPTRIAERLKSLSPGPEFIRLLGSLASLGRTERWLTVVRTAEAHGHPGFTCPALAAENR